MLQRYNGMNPLNMQKTTRAIRQKKKVVKTCPSINQRTKHTHANKNSKLLSSTVTEYLPW